MTTHAPNLSRPSQLSQKKRLDLRDEFFRSTIDPSQLLQPLAAIPGLIYFVKDSQSRSMATSPEAARRLGFGSEEEIVGLSAHEYLSKDFADKFIADDQVVIKSGKPLLNVIEMWLNEQGVRDWIVTNKYPLRNRNQEVVGLVGTIQSFAARRKMLADMGPVGKAVDYIQEHLGEPLFLADIARHTHLSERQLQRLFRNVFGTTIQQFVIQSRIRAAIQEITQSSRSISDIAFSLGFSDQSAFSNQFRAVTGLPPRQYRERYYSTLRGSIRTKMN